MLHLPGYFSKPESHGLNERDKLTPLEIPIEPLSPRSQRVASCDFLNLGIFQPVRDPASGLRWLMEIDQQRCRSKFLRQGLLTPCVSEDDHHAFNAGRVVSRSGYIAPKKSRRAAADSSTPGACCANALAASNQWSALSKEAT